MKRCFEFLLIVVAAVALWCGAAPRATAAIEGKVVRVSDGDTVTVLDADKTQHKIRPLDIDAPESSQAFGQKSKQRLADLIAGRSVRVTWQEKDQYERVLGTIWLSTVNVNLKMVEEGYAWAYHYTKAKEYLDAMARAKAEKRGLWADPHAQDPWAYRKIQKGEPVVDNPAKTGRESKLAPAGGGGKVEYRAGNGPMASRIPAPVNDTWPETGYWLSTNSDKRHGKSCPNYRKTRGYPCGPNDGQPCGICRGR